MLLQFYIPLSALSPLSSAEHIERLGVGLGLDFAMDINMCGGFIHREYLTGTICYHRLSPYV